MWAWLSLLLALSVEGNSNGVGLPCNVNIPNLGSTERTVKNPDRVMWWVLPPVFAGNQYTLRTADTASSATDPTTYTPGEWTTIYVRTMNQDQQFTGLVLYATNGQNNDTMKVGKWQVLAGAPFHVSETDNCIVHSNADPKNYLNVFKFKGPPAGTGKITIKALVKFGLAFPSATGTFFWPNSAHLTLTEKAPTAARVWYEGEVGQSCIDVCAKQGLGCDLATMKAQGNSSGILKKVEAFSNCSGVVLPGCSSASPSVGSAGCFYHSDTCEQPKPQPIWTRNDPCEGLKQWVADPNYYWGSNGNPSCCRYNNSKWCIRYANNQQPNDADQYGAWGGGNKGPCMPAGGYPASVGTIPVPTRANPGPAQITCEARKSSALDGQRICACSRNGQTGQPGQPGQPVADSAFRTSLPILAILIFCLASF